jgi:hypothetical protein
MWAFFAAAIGYRADYIAEKRGRDDGLFKPFAVCPYSKGGYPSVDWPDTL